MFPSLVNGQESLTFESAVWSRFVIEEMVGGGRKERMWGSREGSVVVRLVIISISWFFSKEFNKTIRGGVLKIKDKRWE